MGIPTTYFQKAISGNVTDNDGATILHAGDANLSVNNLSLIENNSNPNFRYGARPALATSPTSSGNIGTAKTISGGVFSNLEERNFIGMKYSSTVAGSASNILKSAGTDTGGPRGRNAWMGYRRYGALSWNYVTGAITKGTGSGDLVNSSGISGSVGAYADQANSYSSNDLVPGELVFHTGALAQPTQVNYASKNNP